MQITDYSFDMETSDPDDIFTLCWLAGHPQINLKCVTVTPGTVEQIGVVRHILSLLNKNIPIGSKKPDHDKQCVSKFHYKWLGNIKPSDPDGLGKDIMLKHINENTKVVCGAALGNISNFINEGGKLKEIFIQGGFAGDSIVPKEFRLEKFDGKETCPTFNLNGDIKAAINVLESKNIENKYLISKNVCHGFVYDKSMHERIKNLSVKSAGIKLIIEGMDIYLNDHKNGKAFHDPLAACTSFCKQICAFTQVDMYRKNGEWGAKLSENSNTFISINGNKEMFEHVFSLGYLNE